MQSCADPKLQTFADAVNTIHMWWVLSFAIILGLMILNIAGCFFREDTFHNIDCPNAYEHALISAGELDAQQTGV